MNKIIDLEKVVIQEFLKSENISYNIEILNNKKVLNRDYTEVGFFTDFVQPFNFNFNEALKSPRGNIVAKLNKTIMVGFVFYVEGRNLIGIEGYTYGDDSWPEVINDIKILD